jgi:hypothetical protein
MLIQIIDNIIFTSSIFRHFLFECLLFRCNLASVALPMFVNSKREFDFKKLYDVVYVVTKNLNKVIDVNYYPVKQAEYSNKKNRPIGIGVQVRTKQKQIINSQ